MKDKPQTPEMKAKTAIKKDLAELINKYSKENESNTPDYILAQYLDDCLTK